MFLFEGESDQQFPTRSSYQFTCSQSYINIYKYHAFNIGPPNKNIDIRIIYKQNAEYNNLNIEMESSYQKLIHDLDARQKHILQLESEMLRIDYQYGVIVKDLKQQYISIAQELSNNNRHSKQMKRQIKKLNSIIVAKQKEYEQSMSKFEEEKLRTSFIEQTNKRLKNQNEQLKSQIKYLQGNQSKYQIKIQQANKKKQLIREDCDKLKQKNEQLQKQVKKTQQKRKQLQQIIQQQVLQTKQRISHIGTELITQSALQMTKPNATLLNIYQQNNCRNCLNSTIKVNPQQLLNDWQSDMKKLKNCIDYGSSYILLFDPMNLDRNISRQIFKFFKNCLKDKQNSENKIIELQMNQQKLVTEHKRILQHFQYELQSIMQQKNRNHKIDTQIQTENNVNYDAQKAMMQINQLSTKLKIKNSTLVQCIDFMALRSVSLKNLLNNSHINSKYYKSFAKLESNGKKQNITNKTKMKKIFYAVYFIYILQNKISFSSKLKHSLVKMKESRLKSVSLKLNSQTLYLKSKGVKNLQLQKLKQKLILQQQQVPIVVQDIIQYYEFKFKSTLQQKQLLKQIKF